MLPRFDALSVRESSGVTILRETFDVSGMQVLDPTLLLDAEDYQSIIDSEPLTLPKNYIAVMFLDSEHWEELKNSNIYKELAQSYKFINICKDENNDFRPVAHWLNFIKNAQYVITDSFHGSVFSIIFKKKFVTVATALRGNARIESLCRTLDIPLSRFYPSLIDISPTFFDEDIDYDHINKKIEDGRKISLDFLEKSLSCKAKVKDFIVITRDKLVIPILTVKHTQTHKTLMLFNILPILSKKTGSNQLFFLKNIPIPLEQIKSQCKSMLKSLLTIKNK